MPRTPQPDARRTSPRCGGHRGVSGPHQAFQSTKTLAPVPATVFVPRAVAHRCTTRPFPSPVERDAAARHHLRLAPRPDAGRCAQVRPAPSCPPTPVTTSRPDHVRHREQASQHVGHARNSFECAATFPQVRNVHAKARKIVFCSHSFCLPYGPKRETIKRQGVAPVVTHQGS